MCIAILVWMAVYKSVVGSSASPNHVPEPKRVVYMSVVAHASGWTRTHAVIIRCIHRYGWIYVRLVIHKSCIVYKHDHLSIYVSSSCSYVRMKFQFDATRSEMHDISRKTRHVSGFTDMWQDIMIRIGHFGQFVRYINVVFYLAWHMCGCWLYITTFRTNVVIYNQQPDICHAK